VATHNFVLGRGFDASAALTKRRFVKAGTVSADPQVTAVTGVADVVLGVSEYDVTAADILKGKGASVQMVGIVEVEATGAIAVGGLVAPSANGRAQPAVTTNRVVGICVGHPAANAGDVIDVLLGLPGNII
jgi:Uncharacterized conserved protein (DUF2190)